MTLDDKLSKMRKENNYTQETACKCPQSIQTSNQQMGK